MLVTLKVVPDLSISHYSLRHLDIKIFAETAENEYKDSIRITSNLQAQILETNNNEGNARGKIRTECEKKIKKNYDSSRQHQMKKRKE